MGFLYPYFLWALAGISLPVLIHLFSRKKGKPVLFPSLRFLKAARSMTGRRKKIEEIIILVLRTLLLFSLLIILSGPVLKVSSPFSREGHIIFIVDDSFSMDASAGLSSSEKLKDVLSEALSFIRKPARLALIYLSGEVFPFTHNYSEAASFIKRKDISWQAGNLPLAMEKALKMLEKERGDKIICFFTDLQKRPWNDVSFPEFGKKNVRFLVFDTGNAGINNAGFKRIYFIPGSSGITAEIQNWGDRETSAEIAVSGGQWQKTASFLLKPGALEAISVDIPDTTGRITGSISTGDILSADDNYYFSFAQGPGEKVLVIGDPAETFYIEKALKAVSGEKREVVLISPEGSGDIFPESYSVLFVSCSGRLPEGMAEKVYRYLTEGGSMVCFPGNRVLAAGFNRSWQPAEKFIPFLMPARLKSVKTFAKAAGVGETASFHPLFLPLKGAVHQHTKTVIFRQLFTLDDISGDVLMKTSDGLPLLLEKKIGRGRVLLFTFPMDDTWTNIHYRPFFPVLVNNIFEHLSGTGADTFTAGNKVRMNVPYGTEKVHLYSPDGEKKELQKNPSDEIVFFPPKPGFWTLEFLRKNERVEKIIPVNVDALEGNLERIEIKEISKKIAGAGVTVVKKEKMREFLSKRNRTSEISPALLNAALLLLLLEIILINLLSSRKQGKTDAQNKL